MIIDFDGFSKCINVSAGVEYISVESLSRFQHNVLDHNLITV